MAPRAHFPLGVGWQTRDAFTERLAPRALPWDMVAPHERQALDTHGQTFEQLAARGGLGIFEVVSVLRDENALRVPFRTERQALPELLHLLAVHLQSCPACLAREVHPTRTG